MSSISVKVPHHLSQEEALRRVKEKVEQLKAQYADKAGAVEESWNGYVGSFSVKARISTEGTVTVNPSDVMVQSALPFFATGFKSMIESTVQEHLAKTLA
jgi:putative polyhydroxyalkanoate system protein